jgi:hypothetical protein
MAAARPRMDLRLINIPLRLRYVPRVKVSLLSHNYVLTMPHIEKPAASHRLAAGNFIVPYPVFV